MSDPKDILDYPRTPGWRGRDTSVEAAEALEPEVARLQAAVLAAIRGAGEAGLTADEAALNLGLTPFTARPRCTELARLGLIRGSGARRANLSGRRATVWVAVPQDELDEAQREAERDSRRRRDPNEAERAVRRVIKEEE